MKTSSCPLDAIEIFVAERRREIENKKRPSKLRKHIDELEKALKALSKCCDAKKEPRAIWPSATIYSKLDAAVDYIILAHRDLPPKRWSRYLELDRRFPYFKLRKTIEAFIKRAGEMPQRPYAHLLSLVPQNEKSAKLIKSITDLPKLRTGEIEAKKVVWGEILPIFLQYRRITTKNKKLEVLESKINALGCNERVAYIVYLEIEQEEFHWKNLHHTGLTDAIHWVLDLEEPKFWRVLKSLIGDTEASRSYENIIENAPVRRKNILNRLAQRRHREKV